MATEVDWNSSTFDSSGGGGKTRYIKFSPGKTVKFRPVGKAVSFYKFFVRGPEGSRSVVVDPNDKDQAQDILSEQAGQAIEGSLRYAMNVIDREDNQVKVLEGGNSIFKNFATWARGSGTSPGGQGGGDWAITPEGSGQSRRYTTTFLRNVQFSNDELKKIRTPGELYTLQELYKAIPLKDLVEKAFGERKSKAAAEPEPDTDPQGEGFSADDPNDPINW